MNIKIALNMKIHIIYKLNYIFIIIIDNFFKNFYLIKNYFYILNKYIYYNIN